MSGFSYVDHSYLWTWMSATKLSQLLSTDGCSTKLAGVTMGVTENS